MSKTTRSHPRTIVIDTNRLKKDIEADEKWLESINQFELTPQIEVWISAVKERLAINIGKLSVRNMAASITTPAN